MTREDARKAAEVMLAYADGKKIEVRKGDKWFLTNTAAFNWFDFEYRIKPQDTYRPFKNAEECWQEMQKHKPFGWVCDAFGYFNISKVRDDGCFIETEKISFNELLGFAFADGTPFGIKEEE